LRHDVENVRLHGSDYDELNFPLGFEEPVPELFASPHRSRVAQLVREDRDAWECLEAERAGEEYMANRGKTLNAWRRCTPCMRGTAEEATTMTSPTLTTRRLRIERHNYVEIL
jgi:hypothetical protein